MNFSLTTAGAAFLSLAACLLAHTACDRNSPTPADSGALPTSPASVAAPPPAPPTSGASPAGSASAARSQSAELSAFIQWIGAHRARPESAAVKPTCTGALCVGLCADFRVEPAMACLVDYD